jgi:hypothetical protein
MTGNPPNIIGRDEARALGLKRFFTGKPCKRGHIAERYIGSGRCVQCDRTLTREHARKRRAADPEGYRSRRAAQWAANRQKILERQRERRAANLEKEREKEREAARKYRAADPERIRKNWRRWRTANLDKVRRQKAEWYVKNKDRVRRQQAAYRRRLAITDEAGTTGL